MNLHGLVRGAITAVNPDRIIAYIASTGNTVATGGKVTPTFAAPVNVGAQIQPVSTGDLRHYDFLQGQGLFRAVYLFGTVGGVNRIEAKGGDLLQFGTTVGATVHTWLVKAVDEQWTPNGNWCRVIVVLQLDPNNPT